MELEGESLREVSFPAGGVGAGCIGIAGSGRLADWEIFNHPGKGLRNGFSHFAVRSETPDGSLHAKILNGDMLSDFMGERDGREAMFYGYGWGPLEGDLAGMPHFKKCSMNGRFPVADYVFSDDKFPGKAHIRVMSPFIPGDSDTSSLPAAIFEIRLENPTEEPLRHTAVAVIQNPWNGSAAHNRTVFAGGVRSVVASNDVLPDSTDFGELAVSTDSETSSYQTFLFRGRWQDALEIYWRDMCTPGLFKDRVYETGSPYGHMHDCALLAAHAETQPHAESVFRFVISWFIPNRANTWDPNVEEKLRLSGMKGNLWRNYSTALCSSAADAARRVFSSFGNITRKVNLFADALYSGTIPTAALEGAGANLSTLVSPVCLRLEDGTFWGWEGAGPGAGSCEGSCQHVWNYAQALPLLFPDMERSMRESHALYGFDENGGWQFRLPLPLGIRPSRKYMFRPCVDGTYGEVLKIYREWKISGDNEWLRSMWSTVRKAIEYAWSPKNPDKWDPERTGVITGRQHNTLDMEMFGPSGWLNGLYLAALKAASEMGRACGDPQFSELSMEIFKRGREWTERNLFNGEYYIQKLDIGDASAVVPFLQKGETAEDNPYFDAEHREIKYQIGEGCSIDSHLAQWHASLYGLGEILSPETVKSTLRAIYKYNYKKSIRDVVNPWRSFCLNDESGCLICSWPEGTRKPYIPIPYNSETMHGFEWAAASHMAMCGMEKEAETIAKSIRDRYDGRKRNPWNEIECGSNYARSMAAFSMIQAFSGFRYDMTRGMIGFKNHPSGFSCFWSLGTIWGKFRTEENRAELHILSGQAVFREILIGTGVSADVNGKTAAGHGTPCGWVCKDGIRLSEGDVFCLYTQNTREG